MDYLAACRVVLTMRENKLCLKACNYHPVIYVRPDINHRMGYGKNTPIRRRPHRQDFLHFTKGGEFKIQLRLRKRS
jgi:hypothetical protein